MMPGSSSPTGPEVWTDWVPEVPETISATGVEELVVICWLAKPMGSTYHPCPLRGWVMSGIDPAWRARLRRAASFPRLVALPCLALARSFRFRSSSVIIPLKVAQTPYMPELSMICPDWKVQSSSGATASRRRRIRPMSDPHDDGLVWVLIRAVVPGTAFRGRSSFSHFQPFTTLKPVGFGSPIRERRSGSFSIHQPLFNGEIVFVKPEPERILDEV